MLSYKTSLMSSDEVKYIVWVGGVDDHFKTKEEANQSAKEWRAKGYTDVIIEKSYYS